MNSTSIMRLRTGKTIQTINGKICNAHSERGKGRTAVMATPTDTSTAAGRLEVRRSGWILSAAVVVLALLAGEFVLRQWFPFENTVLQPDARYLYKYIPGSRMLKRVYLGNGRSSILVKINREGRRGPVVSEAARPRIVVYGDSFIAGEETPLEQTFTADLERRLRARVSKTAQVINAGVAGYGPDQESLVMEDEIGRLKPDLVIVAIYSGNDFGDLIRDKLFALDEKERLVSRHPSLAPAARDDFTNLAARSPFQIARRIESASKRVRSSPFTQEIKQRLHMGRAYIPPARKQKKPAGDLSDFLIERDWEFHNTVVDRDPLVYSLFGDSHDIDMSLRPDSPATRYKSVLMERIMERIQGIAARRMAPCVFLFIPAAIDAANWDLAVDAAANPQYRRSGLTDILEQIATDHRMSYINLFQPFYDHRAEKLYYHPDNHWSPAGQQLAADLVADYLIDRQFTTQAGFGLPGR